jgi:hypothetical protein
VTVYFHPGPRGGESAYDLHVPGCDQPWHLPHVLGIYDPHGMRLNWFSSIACGSAPCSLAECAEDQAPYWPANEVHLWLDTSLAPTEHLRNMPASDASWPKGMGR